MQQFHSMTNNQANIDVIHSCIQTSLNYPRHIFTEVLETLHKDLSQGSTALNSHCKYLPPLYLNSALLVWKTDACRPLNQTEVILGPSWDNGLKTPIKRHVVHTTSLLYIPHSDAHCHWCWTTWKSHQLRLAAKHAGSISRKTAGAVWRHVATEKTRNFYTCAASRLRC